MGPGVVARNGTKQPSRLYTYGAQRRTRHLRTHCNQINLANHEPGYQQVRATLQKMSSDEGRQSPENQGPPQDMENTDP